jgi:KaiC/GvpD/RAD55 family RecA-like ATPase
MNTLTIKELEKYVSELSEDEQLELVETIIHRLKDKKSHSPTNTMRLSLDKESFVGMWKDRTDMKDSSAWVKNVRKEEWESKV